MPGRASPTPAYVEPTNDYFMSTILFVCTKSPAFKR